MVDNINNINSLGGANAPRRMHKAYGKQPKQVEKTDSLQVSSDVKRLSQIEGIRLERVMAVKKAMADGSYVTNDKLERAVDKAIDDNFGNEKV